MGYNARKWFPDVQTLLLTPIKAFLIFGQSFNFDGHFSHIYIFITLPMLDNSLIAAQNAQLSWLHYNSSGSMLGLIS
jgi:hypothetical protein